MDRKKIFFWSPMIGYVGTVKATINSAKAIKENSEHEVILLNILGEFNEFKNKNKDIEVINIFSFLNFLPRTGLLSKLSIYFFSFLSLPVLILIFLKRKPNIVITSLVGIFPIFLKIVFFKKLKVFNSIQGYPKLYKFRKFLWKLFYSKSDLIITMTETTKKLLNQAIPELKKIVCIYNPIIDEELYELSNHKLGNESWYFEKNNFNIISIGRLTRQKNYIELLKGFNLFQKKYLKQSENKRINLLILGVGENLKILKKYISENDIKNIYFLGYKKNPFNILIKSNLYISSSLWEDPGHTLIEAAALKVPIITSNCLSGPIDLFDNNNSFVYSSGNYLELAESLNYFFNHCNDQEKNKKIIEAEALSLKFCKKNFFNKLFIHL